MVRLADRPDMTLDVYRGHKKTIQQQQQHSMNLVHVRTVTLSCIVGFENNLVEMVVMKKKYVMNKNHVVRPKVYIKVCT